MFSKGRGAALLAVLLLAAFPGHAQEEGEWPLPSGTVQGLRFSPLDEINVTNAGRLGLAFSFDTGLKHGQESATLVVGGTMYFVTSFRARR
jgi:glucose dehydrogenase